MLQYAKFLLSLYSCIFVCTSIFTIVSSFNFKDDIDIERAKRALDRANGYLQSSDPNIDKERALKAKIRAEARIALWEGK